MTRQQVDELFAKLREEDPDLVAAVDDVDMTLLEWFAGLSLEERLAAAERFGRSLAEWTVGPS